MNNKTQKRANRSPRSKVAMPNARVSYCAYLPQLGRIGNATHEAREFFSAEEKHNVFPCSVRPFPTKSAAQAKVRFDNLGWEGKVAVVARFMKAVRRQIWDPLDGEDFIANSNAHALLSAIGERPERGGK